MQKIFKNIATILILSILQNTLGQERVITGKVIGQELIEFPGVVLYNSNSKAIDTTDFYGNFEFEYSEINKKITLIFPMTQKEEVQIAENCNRVEIILLNAWIYDYVTLKKAKRKEKRDRKRILPKLYSEAYLKGIFKNKEPCKL